MKQFHRNKDESENAFIWRVCDSKDLIGTWQDVRDILNDELGHDYDESWYRKMYQSFMSVFEVIKDKYIDEEYLNVIDEKLAELERAKVKLKDERVHHTRAIRTEARVEDRLDYLEKVIEKTKPCRLVARKDKGSNNDLLVMLTDLHIGQTFASAWGAYNSDVAKIRLENYLSEIAKIKKAHNSQDCYLSIQGDLISNSIHKTLAITNRENVIEQIVLASELISEFINQLTKMFRNVVVSNVDGNHSRIDTKDDALKDERLDSLIFWYVKNKLSEIKNVSFIEGLDNTLSLLWIRERAYVAVHGDYDKFNKNVISSISSLLGFIPYCVLFGHNHYPATSEIGGVKLVQSGSLPGSGDDYSIQCRLIGKPSQTVLVCNEDGIYANYTIEFKREDELK